MDFSYLESIARNTVSFLAAHWEALLPIVGVYVAWRMAKWGVRQAGKGALWALSHVVPPRLPLVALGMILGGGSAFGWGLKTDSTPLDGIAVGGGAPAVIVGTILLFGWLKANAPECFVRNKQVYEALVESQIENIEKYGRR